MIGATRISNLITAIFVLVVTGPASAEPVVIRDVDYIADAVYTDNKDRLDIFMPEGAENVPVIVYFHGGALSEGKKERGEGVAARVIESGIGFVSANHRLSPGVMHPAHIQDAAAATAWVIRNIQDYGGDPNNVFVSGHSSGAYLATLLAIDSTHVGAHGVDTDSIRGAIPISPFLYVEETAAVRPKTVWGTDPVTWLSASVTNHIRNGLGPMLLIYADGDSDWRKDQINRFANSMRAVGNEKVQAIEVPNRNHGSLVSDIGADDDQIGKLIAGFINESSSSDFE